MSRNLLVAVVVLLALVLLYTAVGLHSQSAPNIPSFGYTLHIDATKHINDLPDWVVHHYCKSLPDGIIQCLLYDTDDPNAHLIGVETVVSSQLWATFSDAEKANWHYHKIELTMVDPKFPGLSQAEIDKVVAALQETYGKVVIFWKPGDPAPVVAPSITCPYMKCMK
jgi:hypothetical protein